MMDTAGLGKMLLYGRRSPGAIKTASLEAMEEGEVVDFDIDLYNAKSEFRKHQAEVSYTRKTR
jgi:hypothetical protein